MATEMTAKDPSAMLMLSGGQTRANAGPRSESGSYLDALELLSPPSLPSILPRVFTEDYARDSLQNLLFALCRFHQITDSFPQKITMVGFTFKGRRFRELHAREVVVAGTKFEYVGVPCEGVADDQELDDAFPVFQKDPTGCSKELFNKRVLRNPFHQVHPYHACPHSLIRKSCHAQV